MIDCIKCSHFYYNNDGSGDCDAPYKDTCLRAHHIFHTDPIDFVEQHLDIKLYPWQKLMLRWSLIKGEDFKIVNRRKQAPKI